MYLFYGGGYTVHRIAMSKQPSVAPCLAPHLSVGAQGPALLVPLAFWVWLSHARSGLSQSVPAVSGPVLRASLHPRFSRPAAFKAPPSPEGILEVSEGFPCQLRNETHRHEVHATSNAGLAPSLLCE